MTLVVVAVLGALQVAMAWREIVTSGMDIMQDYVAGQRLLAGGDIYAPIRPAEVSALGVHEEYRTGMRLNVHPPFTALVFAPLALLPFPIATWLWTLASVAILLGVLRLLIAGFDLPLRGPWLGIALALPLHWYPVWQHLHVGQFTIVILALLVGAWLCERRGHPVLAGCLVGAAVMLKIYPALMLAYALVRRRFRVVAGAVVAMLGLAVVQSTVNPTQWPEYLTSVAPANAAEWMPHARNGSLASISLRLFVGSDEVEPLLHAPFAELPVRTAFYLGILVLQSAWLWRTRHRPDSTAEYCLCLSTVSTLSPLAWDHAILLLVMPFLYLWWRYRQGTLRRTGFPLACAGIAILLSLFPAEIAFAGFKQFFVTRPMPAFVHLHATGLLVMLLGFVATFAAVWQLPAAVADRQTRTPSS